MRIAFMVSALALAVAAPAVAQQKPAAPAATSAIPAPPMTPATYQLICQASASVGFDWTGSDWKTAQFKPEAHIVQVGGPSVCFGMNQINDPYPIPNFKSRKVCGNIRRIGDPFYPIASGECTEYYTWRDGAWSIELACIARQQTIRAKLNGWYHMSFTHDYLDNAAPSKDSLNVEVGKCSAVPG
jgi:hypothetical protein